MLYPTSQDMLYLIIALPDSNDWPLSEFAVTHTSRHALRSKEKVQHLPDCHLSCREIRSKKVMNMKNMKRTLRHSLFAEPQKERMKMRCIGRTSQKTEHSDRQ